MSRKEKKRRPFPHTYVLLAGIIALAALLTWIIPGGQFDRETVVVQGVERSVVVADSYQQVPNQPQHIHVLTAIFEGLERTASVIFYIIIIGGSFWLLNTTRAIDVAITGFLGYTDRLKKMRLLRFIGVDNIIVTLIMLGFSFLGSVIGMSEEVIPFVIIFVPLAVRMGYDSIVGVSMCFLAAGIGFAGSMLNPFSIGIAQGLAGIPLFSGIEYRFVIWIVLNIIGISYVLLYMSRLRRDPRSSRVYEEDEYWRTHHAANEAIKLRPATRSSWIVYALVYAGLIAAAILYPATTLSFGERSIILYALPVLAGLWAIGAALALRHSTQIFNVTLLLMTILLLVIGVMGYGWYITEIAALFLGMGLLAGIAFGYDGNTIVKHFSEGARDILSAALVIGLATAIIVVLENGLVIDTILNAAAQAMQGYGLTLSVLIMYLFYTMLNFIIASASAKAALTIPLMSQFSDLIGLSRQTTVTVYQLGSGFTQLSSPTSGVLVGVLSIARVPFVKWFQWYLPLMIIMVIVGFLLLLPALWFSLPGF